MRAREVDAVYVVRGVIGRAIETRNLGTDGMKITLRVGSQPAGTGQIRDRRADRLEQRLKKKR
jgi:hypothetical protein